MIDKRVAKVLAQRMADLKTAQKILSLQFLSKEDRTLILCTIPESQLRQIFSEIFQDEKYNRRMCMSACCAQCAWEILEEGSI